jgi:hypothetical protein
MAANGDDDGKTKRLDDDYFKEIARKAKSQNFDDDKTQLVTKNRSAGEDTAKVVERDDSRTRVYRPGSNANVAEGYNTGGNEMDDPPVGWLVAVEGPGKGTVLTLGIGMNTVGRGGDARVSIPFDDQEISRGKSFSVAYDEKNRQFYLLPGEGKTLVYFNEEPVLERLEMSSHMTFQIGQTSFRFVSLCGDSFTWG